MRFLMPVPLLAIFFPHAPLLAGENSAKDTITYLQKLQTDSGGFQPASPKPGAPATASLRATTSAVRALHYHKAELPRRERCVDFVDHCFDTASGGFADMPGGKPDVLTTAIGLLAVVDLKMPQTKYAVAATKYLEDNAKSFEDIRIAAAAFESVMQTPRCKDQWLLEIRKTRNPDGTFGKGQGLARDTGSAIVTLLRIGADIESRDRVLAVLKEGQRNTGGFGKADGGDASDLETTYRVMRAFHMLKSRPADVAALEGFIARCKNADGGYAVSPGQPSSVSGAYFAGIIRHWLDGN